MKYLLTILLFCSCSTTKTFLLDSSESTGNLVARQWVINGILYDTAIITYVTIKKSTPVELIVTDSLKRKDTAKTTIQ